MARFPSLWRGRERRPAGALESLREGIDRLFEDFFAMPGGWGMRAPAGMPPARSSSRTPT